MVIQYFGLGFVKASLGDTVLAFSPTGKKAQIKGPSFGSDIALLPRRDEDYGGVESVTYGNKEPFVVDGPGEYEIAGTMVKGTRAGDDNTIYSVLFDDMHIVHLGPIERAEDLTPEMMESLGEVDILMVPVYNDETLEGAAAAKIASKLSAKMVIPLHYDGGKKKHLEAFLKEEGSSNGKPVDKLTLKKKDLAGKQGEVMVIQSY